MRRAMPFVLLILAACGPVSIDQAERDCAARAYLAQKPQSSVSVRFNSDGSQQLGGSFGVSTDYLAGRDPIDVFRTCVKDRSGQVTTRSYLDYPNRRTG
jgi:hypothetical protein